jgi:uncharacterized membrane protein
MDQLLFSVVLVAALGCGLIAGVFFAFSTFVMKALARLAAAEGIRAMQAINIVVVRSWFIAVFIGTAVMCALLLSYSLLHLDQPGAIFLLIGSPLYLLGCFMVTILFNVSRNEALAKVAPADSASAMLWCGYIAGWTAWNHVRTSAALVAAASFSIALVC